MARKIYIEKERYLKDAPEEVQKTLKELGFDEDFNFGQTFGEFLKEKGEDIEFLDKNLEIRED